MEEPKVNVQELTIKGKTFELVVELNGPKGSWTAGHRLGRGRFWKLRSIFSTRQEAREAVHSEVYREVGVEDHVCGPSCSEGWVDHSLERPR